jgi:hypothetical protein
MTPKEKAQELLWKFNDNADWELDRVLIDGNIYMKRKNLLFETKKFALIAVDEIIASNPIAFDEDDNCIAKDWWQEVKTEIELL